MTSTFKIDVNEIATELSSRPVGAQARNALIHVLNNYDEIEIDFHERTLTPSFADECIGRLAAEIGLSEFKRRVKLLNVDSSSKPLVKHVVLKRCSVAA